MKQEIELKYQISSHADFKRLIALVEKQASDSRQELRQKNIFFDTPSLDLLKNHLVLRLRKENKNYYLCAKSACKLELHNLSVRTEFESLLDPKIAKLMLNNNLSPLEAFCALRATGPKLLAKNILENKFFNIKAALMIIGDFLNTRIKIPLKLGKKNIYLEFDKSIYPDKSIIYEVEIEFLTQQEALEIKPIFEAFLQEAGIQSQQSVAKSARLYKILFNI